MNNLTPQSLIGIALLTLSFYICKNPAPILAVVGFLFMDHSFRKENEKRIAYLKQLEREDEKCNQ